VTIRAFSPEEFESFYTAINDPKKATCMGALSYPYTKEEAIKWFESHEEIEVTWQSLVIANSFE
ncbi:hypothetical protein, partial [Pseudomonas syringae]|uniref:hypothetical protein n=1 Tax=Pseudomonas syringae TaxID=317 RepID=UPI0034D95801